MLKFGKKYEVLRPTGEMDAKGKVLTKQVAEILVIKLDSKDNTHELVYGDEPMTEQALRVLPSPD